MENLSIVDASEADAATILTLLHTAFEEYQGVLDPPSGAHAETLDRVRDKMATARVGLAFDGGVAVGCVFYEPDDGAMHLSRLAVLPECRQRGIGRALVAYVESRARVTGLTSVRLGVRLALPQRRSYYERMGYHLYEMGTHEGYHEPTFVILEKRL